MLPGMIFFVILTLEAIIIPIGYVINFNDYYPQAPDVVNIMSVHPLIVTSFFLVTPILTWIAFSYLNKRNASDYYHALPHTRLAMYTSRVAGVLTWVAAIIVIPSVISFLLIKLIPDIVLVVSGSYIDMMIGCFAASLFVAGSMLCAMSITGTAFSNVVVSILIMFMPRYVMMLMSWFVAQKFPLIPEAYISALLSPKLNIISGIFMGWFIEAGSINAIFTTSSQIYTICAGLFYLALGALLFKRRHSESADRSAPSRLMQAVYRIALTMCVCIPITCICFVGWREADSSEIFLIFVLYLIALLVYFIYELVTTKKFKSLVKALPGLGVVILLNAALLISLTAITSAEIGFAPDPEDIEYIQVVSDNNYTSKYMDIYRFFTKESSKIKITDKEAIRVVSEALKNSIDVTVNGVVPDEYKATEFYESFERYTFKINTGLNSEYRYVRMSTMDHKIVSKALSGHEKYAATWLTLPEAQKDTVYFDLGRSTISDGAYEVFRTMKDEVKKLSFEDWHSFLSSGEYSNFATVTYTTNGYTVTVPVSATLMPKTTACILKKACEFSPVDAAEADKLRDVITDPERIGYIYLFTPDNNGDYRQEYVDAYENNFENIAEFIKEGEIENGDCFIHVCYYDYVTGEYDYLIDRTVRRDVFIKLDDGVKDIMSEIIGEESYKYYD